jgi:hypothetical protein
MANLRATKSIARIPRIGVGLVMAACAFAGRASAQGRTGQNRYPVNVHLSSSVDLLPFLLRAGRPAARDIAAEIVPHAPADFSEVALATARPYAESGVRIVIFYDRVVPLLRWKHAPQATILGYVLAHEIAHVLQGIARHSTTGIMRVRWTENDFMQMGLGVFSFTNEDIQLMQRHLTTLQVPAGCSELLNAGLGNRDVHPIPITGLQAMERFP